MMDQECTMQSSSYYVASVAAVVADTLAAVASVAAVVADTLAAVASVAAVVADVNRIAAIL